MVLTELVEIMKNNGVAGAGGAGFPSYAKLDKRADTIILNCAECEPLLKLHRQVLEKYAHEILSTLTTIADAVEAEKIIIAIKGSYKNAVQAVKSNMSDFPKVSIGILPEIYPAGDEVITIYETTKRVVAPGALPITVGVTVFNVETVYNIYKAIKNSEPVYTKYITIAGEVKNPVTLKAPLGITYGELIKLAGGVTVSDYRLIGGGPMTGRIVSDSDVVTKTSNAVLVLPSSHPLISKKLSKIQVNMKRAMAACCQCRMCTDLCSRHLLGHPIQPHMFMRSVSSGVTRDIAPLINTFFCSQCGLCELYACGQGLSPRTLIGEYKMGLRKNGVPVPKDVPLAPVPEEREMRKVPMSRLTARLGLTRYNLPAPLIDETVSAPKVKILLSQNIGVPAVSCVKTGDSVKQGQVIACAVPEKLSMPVHASISGTVSEVTEKYIVITA